MAWEQAERMSRVHYKCLFVSHFCQIFHHKSVLSPVLEHRSVSTICDQLMRMLGDTVVQIVLDHCHDCSSLSRFCRILVNRTCIHFIVRTEAVHIDASVFIELLCELFCQNGVMSGREVSECVLYCQHLLFCAQDVLALWRMTYCSVICFGLREFCRNSSKYIFMKFILYHLIRVFQCDRIISLYLR